VGRVSAGYPKSVGSWSGSLGTGVVWVADEEELIDYSNERGRNAARQVVKALATDAESSRFKYSL